MASAAEQLVKTERANRDAARARLDADIERIRSDIEQRGIGGRIADEASAKAMAALDEASQVASESKGVIGGTIALLVLWFFRKPIISALVSLFDSGDDNEGNEDDGTW